MDLFIRTMPIDFALLAGTENRLKSKTTAKLKEKQTSTTMVRDPLRTFVVVLAPLFSHYRLPKIIWIPPGWTINYHLRVFTGEEDDFH